MTDTTVVTEATWKPGLPPPIEAPQAAFPRETGYTIEYATWLERDKAEASGWRHIPIAIVTAPDGQEITLLPDQAAHALDLGVTAALSRRRGVGRRMTPSRTQVSSLVVLEFAEAIVGVREVENDAKERPIWRRCAKRS